MTRTAVALGPLLYRAQGNGPAAVTECGSVPGSSAPPPAPARRAARAGPVVMGSGDHVGLLVDGLGDGADADNLLLGWDNAFSRVCEVHEEYWRTGH